MLARLLMALVVKALQGRFLECSVHAFDLDQRSKDVLVWSIKIDVILGTGEVGSVGMEWLSLCHGFFYFSNDVATTWPREVDAIIGHNRMHLVGNNRDEMVQKVTRNPRPRFPMRFDKANFEFDRWQ